MPKRILSVSYDVSLLATRRMLLEREGYEVASSHGFTQALSSCRSAHFDLFILGHSIPLLDKQELIREFRQHCPAPILSLERMGEPRVECEFHVSPDNPEQLLKTVAAILKISEGAAPAQAPHSPDSPTSPRELDGSSQASIP